MPATTASRVNNHRHVHESHCSRHVAHRRGLSGRAADSAEVAILLQRLPRHIEVDLREARRQLLQLRATRQHQLDVARGRGARTKPQLHAPRVERDALVVDPSQLERLQASGRAWAGVGGRGRAWVGVDERAWACVGVRGCAGEGGARR